MCFAKDHALDVAFFRKVDGKNKASVLNSLAEVSIPRISEYHDHEMFIIQHDKGIDITPTRHRVAEYEVCRLELDAEPKTPYLGDVNLEKLQEDIARYNAGSSQTTVIAEAVLSDECSMAKISNLIKLTDHILLNCSFTSAKTVFLAKHNGYSKDVLSLSIHAGKMDMVDIDMYLDRYKWLKKGWPTHPDYFLDLLTHKLVNRQPEKAMDLINKCATAVSGMPYSDRLALKTRWGNASDRKKERWLRRLLGEISSSKGIVFNEDSAETFDEAVITDAGSKFVAKEGKLIS